MHTGEEDHAQSAYQDVDRTHHAKVKLAEDKDKLRKYTSMAWPTLGSRMAEEQNRYLNFLEINCGAL